MPQAEVEDMIMMPYEISAPGLSGKTITLSKYLFQEIPGIFTAAICLQHGIYYHTCCSSVSRSKK
jgi:hypothetical protein